VHWIYLSPHFDDVALSCGGLAWEQAQQGNRVSIWTICAGNPLAGDLSPFARALHERWNFDQQAPYQRQQEDMQSCHRLGAEPRYFSLPDCIYRRDEKTCEFMYASEEALNGPIHPGDTASIATLREELKLALPVDATLICPLALGNHVDHQLIRLAAEGLKQLAWYYADFPYVSRDETQLWQLAREGWLSQVFLLSPQGLEAWIYSIQAHASQINTFWEDELAMRQAVTHYFLENGGIRLWRPPRG
jgi:LmbE family N-acetylglucosaminyl deacetylase